MNLKLMFLILILAAACGRKDELVEGPPRRAQPVEVEEPEEIEIPEYSYGGDAYRSPFSPGSRRRTVAEEDVPLHLEDLNLEALTVTGVVSDPRRKYAILSGPDEFYIAAGGRLLDENERPLSGVAVVISEEKVTLITEDEKTIELQAPQW